MINKKYLTGEYKTGTSFFDGLVEEAVIEFQTAVGLPADGIVGRETVLKLKK